MNSLSWFLYLADVVSNFGVVLILVSLCVVVAWIIRAISTAIHNDGVPTSSERPYPSAAKNISVLCFLFILVAFVPHKNTMYAMAISEFGEQVLKTETMQEISGDAQKALKAWIKAQMEPKEKSK